MGQPHVNEEQNPQNNNSGNIRFPNQMIEQINIALEQKVRDSLVIEACCRRLRRSESIRHQLKVMKNEHPAFLPPNRTIL